MAHYDAQFAKQLHPFLLWDVLDNINQTQTQIDVADLRLEC